MQVCKCERGAHNTGRARRERERCVCVQRRCAALLQCCSAAFSQKPPHVPEERAATFGDRDVAQRKRRECAGTGQSRDRLLLSACRALIGDWGFGGGEGLERKESGMAGGLTCATSTRELLAQGRAREPGKEDEKASRPGQASNWSVGGGQAWEGPGCSTCGQEAGLVQHGAARPQAAQNGAGMEEGKKGRWVEVVSRSVWDWSAR